MEWKATANLGLVEEGAVVGEDPVALLEGWLRRVLALALVLLLVVLVAATAARVGVGGAPHGFGSPLAGGEGNGGGAERSGRDEGGAAARWKQFRADGPSLFALDSMGPNATACPQSCEI